MFPSTVRSLPIFHRFMYPCLAPPHAPRSKHGGVALLGGELPGGPAPAPGAEPSGAPLLAAGRALWLLADLCGGSRGAAVGMVPRCDVAGVFSVLPWLYFRDFFLKFFFWIFFLDCFCNLCNDLCNNLAHIFTCLPLLRCCPGAPQVLAAGCQHLRGAAAGGGAGQGPGAPCWAHHQRCVFTEATAQWGWLIAVRLCMHTCLHMAS